MCVSFLRLPVQLESDLELHLAALIAGPSSRLWSGGSFYAFVGEQVAWVEKGQSRSNLKPRAGLERPFFATMHGLFSSSL
jgi:hypothetical protein